MKKFYHLLFVISLFYSLFTNEIYCQNTNATVGTMQGAFQVGPSGAGIYTVPLRVPKGRMGMTPSLALVYNSLGSNGLLGEKWGLGGISAITRVGADLYHDGKISPVDFFNNDLFALDGNRLIPVNPDKSIFHTEKETYSKIEKVNIGLDVGFKVYLKNGEIAEYGLTDDSRIETILTDSSSGNLPQLPHTLIWKINKITDRKGNYIEFKYNKKDGFGEIGKINYTGNSETGDAPFYSIKFNYRTRQNMIKNFVSGTSFEINDLMTSIDVLYDGTVISTYTMLYNEEGHAHLISVKNSRNGKFLNPETFQWVTATGQKWGTKVTTIQHSTYRKDFMLGDYNGDGKTDVACMVHENYHDVLAIYYSNGNGFDAPKKFGKIPDNLQYYMTGDFNGDGRDDLVAVIATGLLEYYFFSSSGELERNDWENSSMFDKYLQSDVPAKYYFNDLDFTGNGRADLLFVKYNIPGGAFGDTTKIILHEYYGPAYHGEKIPDVYYYFLQHGDNTLQPVKTGDFNGDGKTDILVNAAETTTVLLQLDETTHKLVEIGPHLSFPDKYTTTYVGDFNGDGISDILTSNNNQLTIHYADGNGKWIEQPVNETGIGSVPVLDFNHEYKDYKIVVADFNGDGKADVLQKYNTYNKVSDGGFLHMFHWEYYNTTWNLYYSTGMGFKKESFITTDASLKNPDLRTQCDFNGDGKLDLFMENESYSYPVSLMYFHKDEQNDLINKFINGLGVETNISYKWMTDATVYAKGTGATYPLINIEKPLTLVSSVSIPNGTGGAYRSDYYYTGALYHAKGLGFLGFQQVKKTNYQKNTVTYDKFSIFSKYVNTKTYYFFPYLEESETYALANGVQTVLLMDRKNQLDVKQTVTGNNYIYFPVVTKSIIHKMDLNGSVIGTHATLQQVSDIDDFGNRTKTVSLDDPGTLDFSASADSYQFKTTVEKTFSNDVSHWLIGLPLSVTVTKGGKDFSAAQETKHRVNYTYYSSGSLSWPLLKYKQTLPVKTNPASEYNYNAYTLQTGYEYDKYGNIIKETLSAPSANPSLADRVTLFEYDNSNAGRFLTKITKLSTGSSFVTSYVYDPAWGHVLQQTDPNGLITTFEYDDFGRLTKTNLPDGTVSQTTIAWSSGNSDAPADALYFVTSTHTGESPVTTFYDKFKRMLRQVTTDMKGRKRFVDRSYNAEGLLEQTTAPYFSGSGANAATTTVFAYDALGRVLSKSNSANTINYDYDGRISKVTNNGTQTIVTTRSNVLGKPISVTDPSGTIVYHYNSAGRVTSVDALGRTTTMEYDPLGNRTKLVDPSAGTSTYKYNAYGELISQTDARNYNYTMTYDVLGRITSKTLNNGNETVLYSYNNTSGQNGFGQLKSVSSSNGTVYNYSYDNLNRLQSKTETVDGVNYVFSYHYNSAGKMDTYTYPSGYVVQYTYFPNGRLKTVMHGTKVLWEAVESNALGQLTQYSLGNGLTTSKTFDTYGMPGEIKTGAVQDLSYVFDPATGNLNSRKDKLYNLTETFTYDPLLHTRLASWQVNNGKRYAISYFNDGRVNTKTDITTYSSAQYSNGNYAVSSIPNTDNPYSLQATPQQVSYTPFNKIKTIKQFEPAPNAAHYYYETFDYGPFNQRKKTMLYHDNNLLRTKIFVSSDYEIEKTPDGHTRKLHYLSGGTGLFAIFVQNNGADSMYYIHKDYLGSYQTITDAAGHVVERLSFDPWGRRRNAQTWTFSNVPSSYLFDRGFTGHEHMGHFALINMGGRVYDPVPGSFLSPDPFVQAPANPQNYNRYGYALNNPLKYTDPTGYYTAPAPGAVSWLGGGGGWGESSGWANVGPHWSHYMPNVFIDPVWGYRYDWDTKTYYAEHYYGNDEVVSFKEVRDEYILPNSVDITNLVLSPRSNSNKNSKGNGVVENAHHIIDFAGVMVSVENWLEGLNGNLGAFVNGFKAIDQDMFLSGEIISGAQFAKDLLNGNYNDAIGPELDMFMMYAMEYGGEAGLMIGGAYFIGKIAYQIYGNYSLPYNNLNIIQPLNPADNTNMIIPYMPLPALAPNPYQNIELIQGTVHYNYK